ncbi:acyl-CoA thioesterase [Rugamonas apoptosis]|uniref:Acyl-CoA thioesterase n=1 Tax=Rugamonas apoptosis TaxID=2758570 RepID=A0A7W2F5N3_9BURK|nr:thioesterase family protein [Rugamonas apoptosis]MBA5685539.1 acyl-CoA thioesterase [Rugamonas apoptosis]
MILRNAGREQFRHFMTIPTRWIDNDQYGHVNNVVYYSYFDTAVNQFLIERGVLDIHNDQLVGYVVDSACAYFSQLSFPDLLHVGLRVSKLGNSSVRYEIGIYRNDEPVPAAAGHFVHVYVDRATNKPVTIPEHVRAVLSTL